MTLADTIARLPYDAPRFERGHVWLAGAGPGGLGCVTIDLMHALSQADAVVYDALVNPSLLEAAPQAEHYSAGKRGGGPSVPQAQTNKLLIDLARAGKRVLRLKGGDPTMFARGGEEALELAKAGVPFRFLPGLTSALGALAAAGMPATMRGVNQAIIFATGHPADIGDELDWAALARTGHPIVIYMGVSKIGPITEALMGGGLAPATPAAVIMSATTPDERIVTAPLGEIARRVGEAGIVAPALIVIGDIVAAREALRIRATAEEPA